MPSHPGVSSESLTVTRLIDACRNLAWHPARGHREHGPNEWERGHGVRRSPKWDAAHWYLCCIYLRRHALPVLSCPHRVRSSPVFLFVRDYYNDRSGRERESHLDWLRSFPAQDQHPRFDPEQRLTSSGLEQFGSSSLGRRVEARFNSLDFPNFLRNTWSGSSW